LVRDPFSYSAWDVTKHGKKAHDQDCQPCDNLSTKSFKFDRRVFQRQ
jgi:hypothetical protein